jgi:hypothetical protein
MNLRNKMLKQRVFGLTGDNPAGLTLRLKTVYYTESNEAGRRDRPFQHRGHHQLALSTGPDDSPHVRMKFSIPSNAPHYFLRLTFEP